MPGKTVFAQAMVDITVAITALYMLRRHIRQEGGDLRAMATAAIPALRHLVGNVWVVALFAGQVVGLELMFENIFNFVAGNTILLKRRTPDMWVVAGQAIAVLGWDVRVIHNAAFADMAITTGIIALVVKIRYPVAILAVLVLSGLVFPAGIKQPVMALQT